MELTPLDSISPKPIWLLDIDGVINAVSRNLDRNVWPINFWRSEKVTNRTGTYIITVSQAVIDFITYIHDEDLADIYWHSTWQNDSNNLGKHFDLPQFPVWEAPEFGESTPLATWKWWKTPGFLRALNTGRPVIWTDDDIPLVDERKFAGQEFALLIAPYTGTGLSPKHLRKIASYIERHTGFEIS
jgi:hypothetical protein